MLMRRLMAHLLRPFARMEQAWEAWLDLQPLDEGERGRRQALLGEMNEAVRESVRQNLQDFEAALDADPAPLQALRRELMDSVDRRLLNTEILGLPPEVRAKLRQQSPDILQRDEEARTYIAANEV